MSSTAAPLSREVPSRFVSGFSWASLDTTNRLYTAARFPRLRYRTTFRRALPPIIAEEPFFVSTGNHARHRRHRKPRAVGPDYSERSLRTFRVMDDPGSAGTAAAAAAATTAAPGGTGNDGEDTPVFVYGTLMNDKVRDV